MCFKLGPAPFQLSTPRQTFSNFRLNEGGRENVYFSTESWLYLENGERHGLGYF